MPLDITTTVQPKPTRRRAARLVSDWSFAPRKVTVKDRMFFTEQLSLLLQAGVALHPGLEALQKQADNPALVSVVQELQEDVAAGRPFADALARHPQAFSPTYVNLVRAGEGAGFLPQVLRELLELDEKREKLRNTLVSALSYPVFLTFFSAAVVVFILVFVFPKFSGFFSAIRDQLPITTRFLMGLSELFREHWLALSGCGAVGLLGVTQWLKRPEALLLVDRLKLQLPGLRGIFVELYLVHTLRVLSLSTANGVGVLEALAACREVVRNRLFRAFIEGVERHATEGKGIAIAFREARFIPPVVGQMVTTGEETGNLALVMGRVADFYERQLSKRVSTVSKLAEPVMLLVMGVLVGLIVSSLILPIFKLSRAVH